MPYSFSFYHAFDVRPVISTSHKQQHTGKDNYIVPTLVPVEDEQSDTPVLDFYRNEDLIIVPATQISPSGRCTPTPEHQDELVTVAASTAR